MRNFKKLGLVVIGILIAAAIVFLGWGFSDSESAFKSPVINNLGASSRGMN